MAGIDKVYCSRKKDFLELYYWCEKFDDIYFKETGQSLMDSFYCRHYEADDITWGTGYPITNTSFKQDEWMWKHCPIKWWREYAGNIWGYKENKREELLYIDRPFDVDEYRNRKTNEALKN